MTDTTDLARLRELAVLATQERDQAKAACEVSWVHGAGSAATTASLYADEARELAERLGPGGDQGWLQVAAAAAAEAEAWAEAAEDAELAEGRREGSE